MNTVNHYNVAEKTHKHTCMQAHINISAPVWCRQTSVSSVVANSTYYKCYKNEKKKKVGRRAEHSVIVDVSALSSD